MFKKNFPVGVTGKINIERLVVERAKWWVVANGDRSLVDIDAFFFMFFYMREE